MEKVFDARSVCYLKKNSLWFGMRGIYFVLALTAIFLDTLLLKLYKLYKFGEKVEIILSDTCQYPYWYYA